MYLAKLKLWNFRKYATKDNGEILNTWLKMRPSEIAERMQLFTVKSPDNLKVILES